MAQNDVTTGFDSMVNPQQEFDVNQYIKPPASPEEFQSRLAGWADFGAQVQKNPVLQMTLLKFAANMFQGRQPGQGTMGAVAGGALDAVEYGQRMSAAGREGQMKAETHQANLTQTQAQTASTQASTAKTKQDTEFAAQRQPLLVKTDELRAAEAALSVKKAEYDQLVRDKTPASELVVHARELRKLETAKARAEITAKEQSALRDFSAAALNDAQTEAINSGRTKSGGTPGGGGGGGSGPDVRKEVGRHAIGDNRVLINRRLQDGTIESTVEEVIPPVKDAMEAKDRARIYADAEGRGQDKAYVSALARKFLEGTVRRYKVVGDQLVPLGGQEQKEQKTSTGVQSSYTWDQLMGKK